MKNKTKKLITTLLIISTICLIAPKPARAGWWGEDMLAVQWKQMMEDMKKKIEDSLVASLKIAAIRIIQARLMQVMSKATGGSSMGISGMIISNWEQFIYGTANQYATSVTNNFFQSMSSGVPSSLTQRVLSPAQSALSNNNFSKQPDLQNYVTEGKAEKIFTSGYTSNSWTTWNKAWEPQNDLASNYMRMYGIQMAALSIKSESQKAEGVAGQGYKSGESSNAGTYETTASNGKTVTVPAGSTGSTFKTQNITVPGSQVANTNFKAFGMSFDMVALARSIPEVVASMVTQVITQTISTGIQTAASKLSGESTSMSSTDYGTYLNSAGTSVMMGTSSGIQNMIQQGWK